ncbi:MAG: alcohol dehydrogenase catalytic domain-containing protein [Myxococcota bacterium]|nr:alcohol dehydrogenase catalytic domain-containing protein [Myxococcota bacterium]
MRQLSCVGPNDVAWREVAAPALAGDGEAIVRPLAVARCEIDPFLTSGLFPASEPFALGHECVAEIVELGGGVRGLEPGQRVVVAFQLSCGRCGTCRAGHSGNCDAYPVLSDYGMQPLSGTEYGGMLSDALRVPHAEAMLCPVPDGIEPAALASLSDNVLDGYRTVAPHLAEQPGAEVLVVCHGSRSIALYAVQAALALGAGRVDFACDDDEALALAARLGARPVATDFARRQDRYPIVADCGMRAEGLRYALESTLPEGICHSASYLPAPETPLPLGKLYTRGIRFFVGRAHAVSLLPEVMPLVAAGRLRPQEVTTRVVGWEDAPTAWLEPAIKLVVTRD